MRTAATIVLGLLIVILVFVGAAAQDDANSDARQIVLDAMAEVVSIPAQADAIVDLAWPEGDVDAAVRAEARLMIVQFGAHGMRATRRIINTRPEYSADAVLALIETQSRAESGLPPDYLVALEEALWFGSIEAKRIAIPELARYPHPPALLPMIDSAIEAPELMPTVIVALGQMRNDRARVWLSQLLNGSEVQYRESAAFALAMIGGRALQPLKEAATVDDQAIRETAARALATAATAEDLTVLHEYVATHPEDDPEVVDMVRAKAIALEKALEAYHDTESSSPDPDF